MRGVRPGLLVVYLFTYMLGCVLLWDFMGSYTVKKLFKLLPGFMT
jgi:hypothetical protein